MDPARDWQATVTFTFLHIGAPATGQGVVSYLQSTRLCGAQVSIDTAEYGLGQCTLTLLKDGGNITLGAVALTPGQHTLTYTWSAAGGELKLGMDGVSLISAVTSLGSAAVDFELDIFQSADPTNFAVNAVEVDYLQ